jgi:hypothetical protein
VNVKQTGVLSKRRCLLLALLFAPISIFATDTNNRFLGAQSCNSSSCHGGAGEMSNQNIIWSQHDPHSKSFPTLVTARSERIAESLNITNAAKNARCTVCHAPFATVPLELAATVLDPAEGVSCESCHGMASAWLRSHTRKDFSHADKVATGMRELRNVYDRANACVSCHQNVDADILAAGHPELIFELDGQAVTERKHWREQTNWSGAQTWLVGQAVALREVSWSLEAKRNEDQQARWAGLSWVLGELDNVFRAKVAGLQQLRISGVTDIPPLFSKVCDSVAKQAAQLKWSPHDIRSCLRRLAQTSATFRDTTVPRTIQARRAERLVLALDRLLLATKWKSDQANVALDHLFKLAQSRPDFDPAQFATALADFAKVVSPDDKPQAQ